MALNRSPEFCLKLTYRNLLKADQGHYLNKLGRGLGRGPLGNAIYQISGL